MINIAAVLVVAVLSMVVGGYWYSTKLFGPVWRNAMGISQRRMKEMKADIGKLYGMGAICTIVTSYVLAYALDILMISQVQKGLEMAFVIWIGFIAPIMFGRMLWEKYDLRLFFINSGYQLISMFLMTWILVVWI